MRLFFLSNFNIIQNIYSRYRLEVFSIFSSDAIKEDVESIISYYRTNNIYDLCHFLNIKLVTTELGQITGLLQYFNTQPIIQINSKEAFKCFSIAYILGHFFFTFDPHKSLVIKNTLNHKELIFATELLLTDEMLLSNFTEIIGKDHKEIAKFFNLPISAIHIKINGI